MSNGIAKLITIVLMLCVGTMFYGGEDLYAKDSMPKSGVSPRSKENVIMEMKLEFSKKDEPRKVYTHSFEIAEGQNFTFQNEETLTYTIHNKDDQGKETADIRFLDVGETLSLLPFIVGNNINIQYDITVSYFFNIKLGENEIPDVNQAKFQGTSVHVDQEFIKIYSTKNSDGDETASFYMKVQRKH